VISKCDWGRRSGREPQSQNPAMVGRMPAMNGIGGSQVVGAWPSHSFMDGAMWKDTCCRKMRKWR